MALLVSSSSPLLALPHEPIPLVCTLKDELTKPECNCYLYVKTKIPFLPSTKNLIPNTPSPIKGGLVILNYKGKLHYALTPESGTDEGLLIDECNYKRGTCSKRFLSWQYLREHQAKYWH